MKEKKQKNIFFGILFLATLIMAWIGSSIRSSHIETAYNTAKESKTSEVYDAFYNTAYNCTKEKKHVSDRGVINLEDMTELSQLEVLTVSDTEFIIENAEDNEENITSWVEVQGIGVFTVDLQLAEFIKDDQRQHVLVRTGKPELTKCTVEKAGELYWRNDWKDDSTKEGVELSQRQMSEGRQVIEDSIRQNRKFYERATAAAGDSIKSLVKSWNPQLPELVVEVEFR